MRPNIEEIEEAFEKVQEYLPDVFSHLYYKEKVCEHQIKRIRELEDGLRPFAEMELHVEGYVKYPIRADLEEKHIPKAKEVLDEK